MPHITGIEIAIKIREMQKNKIIPNDMKIMLCSGLTTFDSEQPNNLFDKVLEKPISKRRLIYMLK